jgi:hypothetical protein
MINSKNQYVLKDDPSIRNKDPRRYQSELISFYNKEKGLDVNPKDATSEQWKEFTLWSIEN